MSLGGFLDLGELVKRALKYFVEGLIVALAAYVIPSKRLRLDETLLIALVAAATFSILDTYLPSLAVSARSGGQPCKLPSWTLNNLNYIF
jgi:uncharacterized RDD family membrane protein YckC